ncbi:MAG: trimethylamine methyltransferase family protein, partial [Phycisphaerae bacterium]|nr:trimethylamine methyltransferase family protein [Phycisphaerae bacterium]
MRTPRDPIRFLSAEETETIHRNALRILGQIGMRIDHDEALKYLTAAGCKVNFEARHVLFPEDIVDSRVEKMRRDFAARSEPQRTAARYSHVRFKAEPLRIREDFTVSAGGYCVFIYDTDGLRRPATLNDTRDALRLTAQLDQITHTGLPVAAQDVPLPIRQIVMASELVKHTDKLGGVEALDKFDIEYICRIGEVIRGGPEQLKANPVLVGYAEVKTPLTLDKDMC